MSQGFLSSVDSNVDGWVEMGEKEQEILRTEISELTQTPPGEGVGGLSTLELTLTNSGQTKLSNFAKWDIIVQYYDTGSSYQVKWLPYTEPPLGTNEWTVEGIYLDAGDSTPEVLEQNIFNAGEDMVIQAKLNPAVGDNTTNLVTISAPNGVSASAFFTGY